LPAHWSEAVAILDVAPIFEVGQLVMELVRLHVEAGRLDALALELDVRSQGSALGLELELLVVVSSVALNFGKGGRVVKATGRFSQGVVGVAVGVEELQEPAGHRRGGSL